VILRNFNQKKMTSKERVHLTKRMSRTMSRMFGRNKNKSPPIYYTVPTVGLDVDQTLLLHNDLSNSMTDLTSLSGTSFTDTKQRKSSKGKLSRWWKKLRKSKQHDSMHEKWHKHVSPTTTMTATSATNTIKTLTPTKRYSMPVFKQTSSCEIHITPARVVTPSSTRLSKMVEHHTVPATVFSRAKGTTSALSVTSFGSTVDGNTSRLSMHVMQHGRITNEVDACRSDVTGLPAEDQPMVNTWTGLASATAQPPIAVHTPDVNDPNDSSIMKQDSLLYSEDEVSSSERPALAAPCLPVRRPKRTHPSVGTLFVEPLDPWQGEKSPLHTPYPPPHLSNDSEADVNVEDESSAVIDQQEQVDASFEASSSAIFHAESAPATPTDEVVGGTLDDVFISRTESIPPTMALYGDQRSVTSGASMVSVAVSMEDGYPMMHTADLLLGERVNGFLGLDATNSKEAWSPSAGQRSWTPETRESEHHSEEDGVNTSVVSERSV
jgi:hypothetical protein